MELNKDINFQIHCNFVNLKTAQSTTSLILDGILHVAQLYICARKFNSLHDLLNNVYRVHTPETKQRICFLENWQAILNIDKPFYVEAVDIKMPAFRNITHRREIEIRYYFYLKITFLYHESNTFLNKLCYNMLHLFHNFVNIDNIANLIIYEC